jgi:DNA-binding transcriptional ArsR family regulator
VSDLNSTFAAMSDPVRRAIVMRLAEGEATTSEFSAMFELPELTIRRHLRMLESASIVFYSGKPDGEQRWRLRPEVIIAAGSWFDHLSASFDCAIPPMAHRLSEKLRQTKAPV